MIAGRVNGQPVPTRSVVILAKKAMIATPRSPDDKPAAYREALDEAIARELLFQEAVARGLKADEREIEAAYDRDRVNHKNDSEWEAFLVEQGLTPRTYRIELRVTLTVAALLREELAKIREVSDDEARVAYDLNAALFETGERVRVSHIVVSLPEATSADGRLALRAKAEALLARARKGESFERLAREHSDDRPSADQGGTLPPFARGQMEPAFEDAAFALKVGEISPLVETSLGFHVIRLETRLPSERRGFDAVKETVKARLLEGKRQAAHKALVTALRSRARIETYL